MFGFKPFFYYKQGDVALPREAMSSTDILRIIILNY